MVELDGTGSPAGGGPRAPCAGPGSTDALAVTVGVGVGVSLGETVAVGVVTIGVAATWLDRRGGPPLRAGTAKASVTASRTTTPPMSTTGEIERPPNLNIRRG
jgi:hypothetical protein